MTNVHGFHAFFADWRARPLRTPEWRESKRANFPTEDQWRREYPETVEDVFLGTEEMPFPSWAIDLAAEGAWGMGPPDLGDAGASPPRRAHRYVKAWDVGRKRDAFVGVVLDVTAAPYQVVHYRRHLQTPYPVTQASVEDVHRLYPGETYVEDNGVGDPVIGNLRVPATAWTSSPRTKVEAIMALKVCLERGLLKFRGCPQLEVELRGYMWDDAGIVQDSVIALAIAVHVAGVPVGAVVAAAVREASGRTAPLRAATGRGGGRTSRLAGMPGSARLAAAGARRGQVTGQAADRDGP